jgi:DNA repair protein SbcC/Rad50
MHQIINFSKYIKNKSMKITLEKLSLLNFKGIRSLSVDFHGKDVDIYGENATGKTTIIDSFLWLLFNKDSTDRKDFEIKTLDENNDPYRRLNPEVSARLNIDGDEVVLKKVYEENWVKKRGSIETVFSGHSTTYYWNEVPLKLEDYQAKIGSILNENIFKLITNTSYFNNLKWQDRRNVLLQIAGDITNHDILDKMATLSNKEAVANLTRVLNSKKTIEEYRLEISAKKRKIKEDLVVIPSRIDEAKRGLPEEMDYPALEQELLGNLSEVEKIDQALQDKTKAQKEKQNSVSQKLQEIQEAKTKIQAIEFSIKNSLRDKKQARDQVIMDLERGLRSGTDEYSRINREIPVEENRKAKLVQQQTMLREKYYSVNARKLDFKEGEFSCPTCKREYEATDIELKKIELIKNFNQDKSRQLSEIQTQGKALLNDIAEIGATIIELNRLAEITGIDLTALKNRISKLEGENVTLSQNEVLEYNQLVANHATHKTLVAKIRGLEAEVNAPGTTEDNSALRETKKQLSITIDTLKKSLATKEQREKILARIGELQEQEKHMAGELASLEGIEFSIDQFEKAKMDTLESRINGRFSLVKFKLFETQINGGQVPCCETLINGVPYSDANNAARINSGLDIINTLSKHYDTTAPVFIDNAESVITLMPIESQIIRLVVSAKDKKLRVVSGKPVLQAVA